MSGAYKRSVSLDIEPDGSVRVSVDIKYAKALEKRQGPFNEMIKAVMSRRHILAEIDRQMKLAR